jgi:MoxR-like ATPase
MDDTDPLRFTHYRALGQAILQANLPEDVADCFYRQPASDEPDRPDHRHGFSHSGEQRRSVVLIDEIDKASRDFPNDLLNEIEGYSFRIREFDNRSIRAPSGWEPVVIITSNSEKELPEPFMRRCVYYFIDYPDIDTLERIAQRRLRESLGDAPQLRALIGFFDEQLGGQLQRSPNTAELLRWIAAIAGRGGDPTLGLVTNNAQALHACAGIVAKNPSDLERYHRLLDEALPGPIPPSPGADTEGLAKPR